jgi:hypothetical protein
MLVGIYSFIDDSLIAVGMSIPSFQLRDHQHQLYALSTHASRLEQLETKLGDDKDDDNSTHRFQLQVAVCFLQCIAS